MKATHRGIKRHIRKAPPRGMQHIHNAGVGARGKHDQPLAAQMHRQETFIPQPLIGLPGGIFIIARHLAGQAGFVSGGAGDFATYIEAICDDVFIAHHNRRCTHRFPACRWRHLIHRENAAIRLAAAAFAEHPRMQV